MIRLTVALEDGVNMAKKSEIEPKIRKVLAAVRRAEECGTPYHEAGHAVGHFVCGYAYGKIESISVRKRNKTAGGKRWTIHGSIRFTSQDEDVNYTASVFKESTEPFVRKIAKDDLTGHIVGTLAGLAAEWKWRKDPFPLDWLCNVWSGVGEKCSNTDVAYAFALAKVLTANNDETAGLLLEKVAAWTTELIHVPRVWKVIEALACELDSRKSITGIEAYDVMVHAWDCKPHAYPAGQLGEIWRRRLFSGLRQSEAWNKPPAA